MDSVEHPHQQATANSRLSFLYPKDAAGSWIEKIKLES